MKKIEFTTYRKIESWELDRLKQAEPSCFIDKDEDGNDDVRIRQYRVTVEEVPEESAVLAARLQQLWDRCTNWHIWDVLRSTAKKLGVTLEGAPGRDVGR